MHPISIYGTQMVNHKNYNTWVVLIIYNLTLIFWEQWWRFTTKEKPTRYTPFIIMRYSGLVMQLAFPIIIYLIIHIACFPLLSLFLVGCHHRGEYSRSDLSIPARYRIDYENPRAPARVAHWSWIFLYFLLSVESASSVPEHFIIPFGPRSVGARYQLPAHAQRGAVCVLV